MRVSSIIFAVSAPLVFGAMVYLLMLVTEQPAHPVPQEKLAQALKRYERAQAMKTATGSELKFLQAEQAAEEEEKPAIPWEARAIPAKAPELHTPGLSESLIVRLDNIQTMYRNTEYRAVIDQGIKLLEEVPDNLQLKRLIIRSACIEKEPDIARKYIPELPERDHTFLYSHCERYGVKLD